jgi:hypothetical protein
MSNFLDNLASRSLGLAPVVQPRLASRFEPPPGTARFPSFEPAEDAGLERSVEGEAQHARPEARQPETRVVEDRRAVPIRPPAAPREERAERESRAAAPPRQQSHPPRPAMAAHVPVRPVETRAQNAQTDVAAAPPHAPRSSFAEGAQPREAVRGEASSSVDAAALDNRIRRLMANNFNVREGNEAAGGTPVAHLPARQDEPPEKTQTIRVTIGRIDVRAVTAPAPQEPRRAPARPAPQLSLADYLKQRGGGRR